MDEPKLSEIVDQVRSKTGARIVVLGEEHHSRSSIQYIRDSLNDLKAQGIKTLYLEMASDMQPLLDKALQGDPKAQKELRNKYEGWWHYGGTEGAQQRYDLVFEANKAGIKVKAIDMQTHGDHLHRYNSLTSEDGSGRFAFSDAVMAKNIKAMDDGAGAIALVGRTHTYQYDANNKAEELSGPTDPLSPEAPHRNISYPVYRSEHGGLDTRLKELGIRTASIDFTGSDGTVFALEKSNDTQNDFRLIVPKEEPPKQEYHAAITARSSYERLATLYEQAGLQATAQGDDNLAPGLNKISASLRGVIRNLDDPAFQNIPTEQQTLVLSNRIEAIRQQSLAPYTSASPKIAKDISMPVGSPINPNDAVAIVQDEALSEGLQDLLERTGLDQQAIDMARIEKIVQDNKILNAPELESSWRRQPMKLAGEPSVRTNPGRLEAYSHFTEAPDINSHWQAAQNRKNYYQAPEVEKNNNIKSAPPATSAALNE